MTRRRRTNQGTEKRKRAIGLIVAVLLLLTIVLGSMPYLKHINTYRNAISQYDFNTLSLELTWIEAKAPWLKKIPLVKEGELWFKLNQGVYEDLEQELVHYDKDPQRLWLFQLYLLTDQPEKAKSSILTFKHPAYQKLSEGLLWAHTEEYDKAISAFLTISDGDLDPEKQVMKNIALARSHMAQNNFEQAQKSWQVAAGISSLHPLVVETEYDLALSTGLWSRAKELSSQIKSELDTPYQEGLLVKKALLALIVGDRDKYEDSFEQLGTKQHGEAYTSYLKGFEKYEAGEFSPAVKYLQRALELGLPDFLVKDASLALSQAKERVAADRALKAVTG